MTEEGIDAGGKAGMSRKLIAGIIVAVVVIASIGAYVLLTNNSGISPSSNDRYLYWDTEYTDSGWLIKFVKIENSPYLSDVHPSEIKLILLYKSGMKIDEWTLQELKNTSSVNGVNWIDINDNNYVDVGDYLYINRNDGDGIFNPEEHDLAFSGEGYNFFYPSMYIHLPPAEFLDMDVVKTATGWNMTVTWVNETVPVQFLEGWKIGFRVENETGAFGTFFGIGTGKIGWSVPLDMIGSNYVAEPGTYDAHNMTYYRIDWFDNDADKKLSVNDTIVIEEFSDSEETMTFIFFSSQYGWKHVIFEVTLP